MKRFIGFAVLALGAIVVVQDDARALPRYSARYQQNCNLCHTNPTGGGLRELYATQYLIPSEFAIKQVKVEELEPLNPQVGENLIIGADLRTNYIYSDAAGQQLNFFQMQGDIYFNFILSPRFSLYFDAGSSRTLELFGLGYVLPWNGYLKVGRFLPAFGWKHDDHTYFVRDYLGYFPPDQTDVGIEAGLYPRRFALHLALTNGSLGGIQDDENRDLALTARGVYRFRMGSVALALGGSARYMPVPGGRETAGGGFYYAGWKGLTWVGEVNGIRFEPSTSAAVHSALTTQELVYRVRQGVEVKLTYDLYDPRYYDETGAVQRFGAGVHVFPAQYFTLEGLLRRYDVHGGRDIQGSDFLELVLQFHALY